MKQILIVEDDELLNKMLVYNLQSESYGIVSVETVKEAMEVLKSQQFDLVLLDINLPDGNGYAIAKTIREKYSDTIVIFLTANDRESDEIRGCLLYTSVFWYNGNIRNRRKKQWQTVPKISSSVS